MHGGTRKFSGCIAYLSIFYPSVFAPPLVWVVQVLVDFS